VPADCRCCHLADTRSVGDHQEDEVKKVPDSVKARVFRGAITISSLVALALAAGAGRKFT
jgi:hypothetical protein